MMKHTPQGDTFTDLVVEVFRVNGLLLAAGDQLAHPVGLSSARWQVLGVVEHGPISVAHVAHNMGLARQSVQQTADGLEQDGFITYTENPHHRRSKLMQLTPKGRAALDEIAHRRVAWANSIAGDLVVEDLHTAIHLLRQARERLDQSMRRLPEVNG
jgi:DNA-binding MarR family transcriptional regulator